MSLCPGCAYRPEGPEGLCAECLAARDPQGPACLRCGHFERYADGKCAHCQRARVQARAAWHSRRPRPTTRDPALRLRSCPPTQGPRPCRRCGAVERNAAGDCAPCHRNRERRRYQPTGRPRGRPRTEGPCTVAGCTAASHCKGLCRRHYLRQWRRDRAA